MAMVITVLLEVGLQPCGGGGQLKKRRPERRGEVAGLLREWPSESVGPGAVLGARAALSARGGAGVGCRKRYALCD